MSSLTSTLPAKSRSAGSFSRVGVVLAGESGVDSALAMFVSVVAEVAVVSAEGVGLWLGWTFCCPLKDAAAGVWPLVTGSLRPLGTIPLVAVGLDDAMVVVVVVVAGRCASVVVVGLVGAANGVEPFVTGDKSICVGISFAVAMLVQRVRGVVMLPAIFDFSRKRSKEDGSADGRMTSVSVWLYCSVL